MLKLVNDRLELRLPQTHPDAVLHIEFRRALRGAAGDGARCAPDRGRLPLRDVDGHAERLLCQGVAPGGVFFPLHQGESMRIRLEAPAGYAFALMLTAAGVDAFTGRRANPAPLPSFENYRVILHAREIGALRLPTGVREPFVVPPLVRGPTLAQQLTGTGLGSTLQVTLLAMAAGRHEALREESGRATAKNARQLFGPSAWDEATRTRFFVHALNTRQYLEITGRTPPTTPPTAEDYAQAGLPWRDEFDADRRVLAAARTLVLMDGPPCGYARRTHAPPRPQPARRALALVPTELPAAR